MSHAPRVSSLYWMLVLCALSSIPVLAQMGTATLSGVVTDPKSAVVPDVEVTVTRIETGTTLTTKTNGAGIYFFTGLLPGHYHLMIHKPGFKEIGIKEFELHIQDKLEQNFSLEIGSVSETVTVTANDLNINTMDGSVSTVVDHNYVENMPLNGRSLQDLILLTPGVVTNNPQNRVSVGETGEFSVNGQRTESNYYTVDGISANVGATPSAFPTSGSISGSLPSSTALGTTQGLVSVDALEEFRVQSSTYSAQYGRNPGGQFSFATRSGSNQWHGSAYDYLRNGVFDANDWFNDYFGLPKPELRQNDFGGTFGGAVRIPRVYDGQDKTFFFVSYEGLRLLQPQAATTTYVPDSTVRQNAPAPLQAVLNAFPVANGTDLGNGFAEFLGTGSNPGSIDSGSVRLDHTVGDKLRLFFRFSNTSSSAATHDALAFSVLDSTAFTTRTYTLGATSSLSSSVSNEFRLNYSSNEATSSQVLINTAGSKAVDLFQLQGLKSGIDANIEVGLYFGLGTPDFHYDTISQSRTSSKQQQWNAVDTIAVSHGRHRTAFGVDFRRLTPTVNTSSPVAVYRYLSPSSVETNNVDEGFGEANTPVFPIYTNFSAFVQDEWKLTQRFNVSMGLRWEVNPAPSASKNTMPFTVEGASNLAEMTLAPQGTPLWKTTWYNFAPRLGIAYELRNAEGYETVVRGGGGVFFDTGQQLGSYGYDGPGFSGMDLFGGLFGLPASFPATPAQINPPIVNPPEPPFTSSLVFAFAPHLQLPYTWQWNASVQQALGKSQSLTVSYVGSHGSRLLETQELSVTPLNPNFGYVFFARNGLTSDYNAIQLQYQRRLARGLQALASYTWSHCSDYESQDAALPYERGDCDFDVRHNFSSAFSYDLPDIYGNRFGQTVLHHWGVDTRLTARTAFPVTLAGTSVVNPATGQTYNSGLNLVPDQPIYIYGTQCAAMYDNGLGCPGGRAINPDAFALPTGCDQFSCPPGTAVGDAPRNFTRGFGSWQMDLALRREFPIHERLKLQFRAEAFNVFNHPNFGTINPSYCSPSAGPGCTFGQATATLGNSLGGLSSLYQMGGRRSMQFALKLVF